MAIKQKKAVYNAVVSLYRDSNRHFEDYQVQVELSSDERKTIIQVISQGLASGKIEMTDKARATYNTPKKIHNYATGLVSDRLRKDKRFNCGEPYKTQKPGSRAGAGDDVIKELRAFKKKHCVTAEQKAEADAAIESRLAEIHQEALQNTKIDMDVVNQYLKKVK